MISLHFCGLLWTLSMDFYQLPMIWCRTSRDVHEFPWFLWTSIDWWFSWSSSDFYWFHMLSVDFCGLHMISTELYGFVWLFLDFYGFRRITISVSMELWRLSWSIFKNVYRALFTSIDLWFSLSSVDFYWFPVSFCWFLCEFCEFLCISEKIQDFHGLL